MSLLYYFTQLLIFFAELQLSCVDIIYCIGLVGVKPNYLLTREMSPGVGFVSRIEKGDQALQGRFHILGVRAEIFHQIPSLLQKFHKKICLKSIKFFRLPEADRCVIADSSHNESGCHWDNTGATA
jgi:hypothetical protein